MNNMAEKDRLDFLKDELLENVSSAIKQLQMDSCQITDKERISFTGNMWQVQDLCFQLDCLLSHGLKQSASGYWPFLKEITHKSTVDFIVSFPRAVSSATRGWAWLYLALNECAIESYFRSICSFQSVAGLYYLKNALLRDGQRLQVLLMMVAGLEHLSFDLEVESACLRSWKSAISEITYEPLASEEAEEADCASLASYESGDSEVTRDFDPEVAIVRMMSVAHLTADQSEEEEGDIVHSYVRATRRRPRTRTKTNNNNVNIRMDVLNSIDNISLVKPESNHKLKLESHMLPSVDSGYNGMEGKKEGSMVANGKTPSEFLVSLLSTNNNTNQTVTNDFTDSIGLTSSNCANTDPKPTICSVTVQNVPITPTTVELRRADGDKVKSSKEKRVSFDESTLTKTEAFPPVDIPWDMLNGTTINMTMFERGVPEGQEDPMTSSITSNTKLLPTSVALGMSPDAKSNIAPARLDAKVGASSVRSSIPSSRMDTKVVDPTMLETSSRLVKEEIESELHLALDEAKRKRAEGEVSLENNFHLMIMLEIVVDQQEKVYKVFRATIGHSLGCPTDVFLILSDQRFYIAHWDDDTKHYVVNASFHYSEIEFLQLSPNYQIINIVCALPRQRHWICTGNEEITRNIVTSLDMAIRRNTSVTNPPSVFADQTSHSLGIQKWIAQTAMREMQDSKVNHYSLVWWEDPHNAPDVANPLGPSMEGHLMYRYIGSFVFKKHYWKPGFFRLKAGVLYQFDDPLDRNFRSYVQLIGGECVGCRRVPECDRPHAFELLLSDNRLLQLASPSEKDSSEWLQAMLQTVSVLHSEDTFTSHRTPACLILAAEMLFICHDELETSSLKSLGKASLQDVATVHLDPDDAPYCILEFESVEATQSNGDWLLYFASRQELSKFVNKLDAEWQELFKVPLAHHTMDDPIMIKRCRIHSKLLCRWEKTPHTP